MQQYRDLVDRPRQANRAQAHMVDFIDPEGTEEDLRAALNILQSDNADLRRGDFVFSETHLGYRNDGKYIFDGEEILNLNEEPDEYGSIPTEFQIGEFPPRYWINLIDHNNWIPFDVARNLPNLTLDNIKCMPRLDGKYCHFAIPFLSNNNIMAIVNIDPIDSKDINLMIKAQDFLDEVRNMTYFEFYDPNYNDNNPLDLNNITDYEYILLFVDRD